MSESQSPCKRVGRPDGSVDTETCLNSALDNIGEPDVAKRFDKYAREVTKTIISPIDPIHTEEAVLEDTRQLLTEIYGVDTETCAVILSLIREKVASQRLQQTMGDESQETAQAVQRVVQEPEWVRLMRELNDKRK